MSIQNTSFLIVEAHKEGWNEAIEACAEIAQRWADEASEFKDSPRCEVQVNVCRSMVRAIRRLSKSTGQRT